MNSQRKSFVNIAISQSPKLEIEYADEIFRYLRKKERSHIFQDYFEQSQKDINDSMRRILVDWLVDVSVKFKLQPETLFLTVNLIDKFLEKKVIPFQKLQLVGVTAMFIACKYEEIYVAPLRDFVYVTNKAVSKQDILEMEGEIVLSVDFQLNFTSPYRFLERYAQIAKMEDKPKMLSEYLIDLSLIEYKMLQYRKSLIACAAIYLSHKLFKVKDAWNRNLQISTQYKELSLRQCAKDLCALLKMQEKNELNAIQRKFSQQKYMGISRLSLKKGFPA